MNIQGITNIGKLRLTDIISLDVLQQMQDAFAVSFDMPSIIYDLQGTPITQPSGFTEFCACICSTAKGKANCITSDAKLFEELASKRTPIIRSGCALNNLISACVPILVENVHLANFCVRQIIDGELDPIEVRSYAETIGVNGDELVEKAKKLNTTSKEKLEKALAFLSILTQQIGTLGYQNLQNKELLEKLKLNEEEKIQSLKKAIESEAQQKALIDNALYPITLTTTDNKILYFNKKTYEFFDLEQGSDVTNFNPLTLWANPDRRKQLVAQLMENGYFLNYENEFITLNGTHKTVLLSTSIINYHGENVLFTIYNEITEQKKLEQELIKAKEKTEESEAYFRAISEQAMDGISLADENGNYLFVNKAFCEMTGYSENELLKMSVFDLRPDDEESFTFEKIKNQGYGTVQNKRLKCKNGSIIYADINGQRLVTEGKNFILGIVRDITERVIKEHELIKAKEKAEESEEKLFRIVESTTDFIWTVDPETFGIQTFNTALYKYFEEKRGIEMKIGDTPDILISSRANEWKNFYKKALELGKYEIEYEVIAGTNYLYLSLFKLVRDNKTFGISVFGRDITKLKQNEKDLIAAKEKAEENEALLNATGSIAKIGGWKLVLNTQEHTWSREVFRILEVSDDYQPTIEKSISFFDDNSKKILQQALDNAIQFGNPYDLIVGIITAKGKKLICRTIANVQKDSNGKPELILGSFQDITEQKANEKDLIAAKVLAEESEEKFRSIVKHSPSAIYSYRLEDDNRLVLTEANPSADRIIGIPHTKLVGKTIEEAFPKLALTEIPKIYRQVARRQIGNQFFEIPYEDDRFSGYYSVNVYATQTNSIAVEFVDISERKKLEKDIIAAKDIAEVSEAKLQFIFDTMTEGIALNECVYNEKGEMVDYRILEVNRAYYSIADYKGDKVLGKLASQVYGMSNEYINSFWKEYQRDSKSNVIFEFKSTLNGNWYYISISPIVDGKYITAFFDITKQKQTEKELADYTQRLKLATSSAKLGIWDWNVKGNEMIWDDRMFELYGIERSSSPISLEIWSNCLHPADKQRAIDECNLALKGVRDFNTTFRVVHPTGKVVFIKADAIVVRDQNGDSLRMIGINKDISETKIKEQELFLAKEKALASEAQLQRILDNLQDAYFQADLTGNFVFVNPVAVSMYGFHSQEELIGKPASILYKSISQRDSLLDGLRKVGSIKDFVLQGKRKDGSLFWVSMNVQFVKDNDGKIVGTEGVVRDISERKRFEEELLKAKKRAEEDLEIQRLQKDEIEFNNERLEGLLKISQFQTNSIQELLDFALKEAIELTESKIGYIYFYNEATRQFTLNTWSKDVMKECAVLNPQTIYDLDKTGCWGEAVRQRKPIVINNYKAENPLKKGIPQGHVALKKFLTIPVILEGRIVAVAGVANKESDYNNADIRQLTLLMDSVWKISERLILIDDLKKAKDRAEESDRLKSAFFQNMSHEVRTPLNAIVGFSERINSPTITDEKRAFFSDIIVKSGFQLLAIISDILTVSSLETKQESLYISEVSINTLLMEIHTIFKQQADDKSLELTTSIPPSISKLEVYTDEVKFKEILSNLLSNAIKFTHKGGIDFGYSLKNNEIAFFVKDTGIGINSSKFEKIFDRFVQAEDYIHEEYGGTGIGLSICKGFLELLGGRIWVESEPEKGSTFFFTIPYKPVKGIPESNENSKQEELTHNKLTVLVAEDQEPNYVFLKEFLEDFDCKVIIAVNGKEAVQKCRENESIDFVLMDIKMPVMDGYTAAKLIREFRPLLPIVAQTAYATSQNIEKFRDAFDDYITKPYTADKLSEIIRKHTKP
jgi:PAS domain S-box-containing protein